jgi:hypothetical protein
MGVVGVAAAGLNGGCCWVERGISFRFHPQSSTNQEKKTIRSESRSWHPKNLCSTSMTAPPHIAVFFKQEQLLNTSLIKQDGLFSFRKQRTSDHIYGP